MGIRRRAPETQRLELSGGDWIVVKKHLTAGETREMFARMMHEGEDRIAAAKVGIGKILTYLLDWSDAIVIRDQPENFVKSALDGLEPESYTEILRAIEAHEDAMEQERAAEKNDRATGSVTTPISASAA